jgi:hypothetical protein
MANEITINIPSITYVKDVYNDSLAIGIVNLSVTGKHAIHDSVTCTAANVALAKGNIGTIGFFYFRNKDATNAISITFGSTEYMLLAANGVSLGTAGVATISIKATVGTPLLEYYLVEQ